MVPGATLQSSVFDPTYTAGDIGGDDGEVKILGEMTGHAVGVSSQAVHIGQALLCRFPYMHHQRFRNAVNDT